VVPRANGGAMVIWLDGRGFAGLDEATAEQHAAMGLRYTMIDRDLGLGTASDLEIDARACSCCQTTAVGVGEEVLVAYRDRSADELRDISVARFAQGQWTSPASVFPDRWRIEGCPVNGPSLAAAGTRVALAWFTAADDVAQVKLAISEDGGRHFGAPVRIDDGHPQGRVDVVLIGDRAVVSWQETKGSAVELRVRSVRAGRGAPSRLVTSMPAGRVSGFPQLAVAGSDLVMAWTATDAAGKTQVASGRIAQAEL
jgi:hypothetical protein